MNEFDQFVKRKLKVRYYIRYTDDFVILLDCKNYDRLVYHSKLINQIKDFLEDQLKLELHPGKVFVKTFASGVDFLGWVHFNHNRILRTSSKRRAFRKLNCNPSKAMLNSYLGLLKHGNSYKITKQLDEFRLL